MGSQPKNHKVFTKFSFTSDFVELFPLIILIKKTFRISLKNDDVIVKIFVAKNRRFQFILIGISYTMFNRELFILFAYI
jgi:hypothetical protein